MHLGLSDVPMCDTIHTMPTQRIEVPKGRRFYVSMPQRDATVTLGLRSPDRTHLYESARRSGISHKRPYIIQSLVRIKPIYRIPRHLHELRPVLDGQLERNMLRTCVRDAHKHSPENHRYCGVKEEENSCDDVTDQSGQKGIDQAKFKCVPPLRGVSVPLNFKSSGSFACQSLMSFSSASNFSSVAYVNPDGLNAVVSEKGLGFNH